MNEYAIAICIFFGVLGLIYSIKADEVFPFITYSIISSAGFAVAAYLVMEEGGP